jgi:hypothetical protein
MLEHLGEILDDFPGSANQTRCFAHTLNLSAKAIIKQFDVPKSRVGDDLDEAAEALAAMAKDLDLEDRVEQQSRDAEVNDDDPEDQPLNAWVDFREGLTEEEVEELDKSVQPVRSTLFKVCQF